MNMNDEKKIKQQPTVTFRIDVTRNEKLRRIAKARGISIAKVVKDGIDFQIKVMESQLDVFKQKDKD